MSEQNGPLPFTLETVKAQVRFYQAGPVREMYKKQAETMKSFLLQNETAMTISVMEGDAKEKFLQDTKAANAILLRQYQAARAAEAMVTDAEQAIEAENVAAAVKK